MGLCINYSVSSTAKSAVQAEQLVEQMRQLALDLPFETVGEIVALEGDECDVEREAAGILTYWLAVQGRQCIELPWNDHAYQIVLPTRLLAFHIQPGPGCEPANLGLCSYPSEFECAYRPVKDSRFHEKCEPNGPGSSGCRFSHGKWKEWLEENEHDPNTSPDDERFVETHRIKTGLTGWRWESFTKTQYASDPGCGGMANFLRCHISIVTLLERIGQLPTMQIELNDDGKYGPYRHADDWKEAKAAGREPNFQWRDGHYDPKALVAAVGKWNGIVAAFAGALKDTGNELGIASYAPIQDFPDFEQLEFRGSQDEKLKPFLKQMQEWAKRALRSDENEG